MSGPCTVDERPPQPRVRSCDELGTCQARTPRREGCAGSAWEAIRDFQQNHEAQGPQQFDPPFFSGAMVLALLLLAAGVAAALGTVEVNPFGWFR